MAIRSRTGWKRSEPRSYGPRAPDGSVRRALEAIRFARSVAPSYANGIRPCPSIELERLAAAVALQVKVRPLDHPCLLIPPFHDVACLMLDVGLHRPTREFVIRHEIGHRVAGDADEPIFFHFTDALPEAEYVADLFAFADLISSIDCEQGVEWVAQRMKESLDLAGYIGAQHWYLRVPELAPRLIELTKASSGVPAPRAADPRNTEATER